MKKIIIPPVFVLFSLIIIILFYLLFPDFNLIPFPFNLAGLAVAFAGFFMMGQARQLFKTHETTLDFTKSSALVVEGIYSKTRNPMYIGMFLFLFGVAICFRNIFSCLVPFVFITLIRIIFIPNEETLMTAAFGDEFVNYKNRVRRWI
jgi:protein-S-isoprenylcysteine O-methyltransferase Ste14